MEGWVGLSTMSANNLLKIITRQRSWWDSNPRLLATIVTSPRSYNYQSCSTGYWYSYLLVQYLIQDWPRRHGACSITDCTVTSRVSYLHSLYTYNSYFIYASNSYRHCSAHWRVRLTVCAVYIHTWHCLYFPFHSAIWWIKHLLRRVRRRGWSGGVGGSESQGGWVLHLGMSRTGVTGVIVMDIGQWLTNLNKHRTNTVQHRHWLTVSPAPTIRNLFRHMVRYKCYLLTYLLICSASASEATALCRSTKLMIAKLTSCNFWVTRYLYMTWSVNGHCLS